MTITSTLQIARDMKFTDIVYNKDMADDVRKVTLQWKTDSIPYGVDIYSRVRYNNDDGLHSNGGHSKWSRTVKFKLAIPYQVIGVCIDPSTKTINWVDEAGNELSSFNYLEHPCYQDITMVTEDADRNPVAMTQIPTFYIRTAPSGLSGTFTNGKPTWWISNLPAPGFRPHPAFKRSSGALAPHIKIATYIGNSVSVGGRSCLGSTKSTSAYVSTTKSTLMAMCANRNDSSAGQSGWRSYDIYDHSALQFLALIAKGSSNVQSSFGDSNGSSSPSSGSTNAKLPFSLESDGSAKVFVDDMWGCYWTHVDRISLASNLYAINSPIDNSSIGLSTSYRRPTSSGWVDTVHNGPYTLGGDTHDLMELFLPKDIVGSESLASFKDYYEYTNNCGDMKVAGYWSSGSSAGMWAVTDRGDTYTTTRTEGGTNVWVMNCFSHNGYSSNCGYGYAYAQYYHSGGTIYYRTGTDYFKDYTDKASTRQQPAYNSNGMCPWGRWSTGGSRDAAPCMLDHGWEDSSTVGTHCPHYNAYAKRKGESGYGVAYGAYGYWMQRLEGGHTVTDTHYYNYIAARLAKN